MILLDRTIFCREVTKHLELLQPLTDSVLLHWDYTAFDPSVLLATPQYQANYVY